MRPFPVRFFRSAATLGLVNAQSDPQLLRTYAERRSETAFTELVRRHLGFVHSAAVRMVNDPHLAKDVSQEVFVALAENAGKLADHPVLSGWLHRTARNIAAQTVRTEARRRIREKESAAMHEPTESDASWKETSPHLDAVLAELSETDRAAVLLRYFENKPAHEMAAILNISVEAAQKRVSRALERLRANFAKRGIRNAAAGLALMISANGVQAAPAGLAATISNAALAGTAVSTGTAAAATKLLAMTTLQKTLAAAAIVLVAGIGIHHSGKASAPRNEAQALRQQGTVVAPPRHRPQLASVQSSRVAANPERLIRENRELEQRNAALLDELAKARQSLEFAKKQSVFLHGITAKLAGGEELRVPESIPELAVLYGHVQLRSRDFHDEWNGRPPGEGTPEAAIYEEELDANTANDATLMKAFATIVDDGFMGDPSSVAEFQSLQLYGALGLDEAQWRQLDGVLQRIYAESFDNKLNGAARPSTGLEEWEERRTQMSRSAFAEIRSLFTPPQRVEFERLYTPGFLLGLSIGGPQPKK